MAQSSENEQQNSMMEEALKILKDEGFSLPNDVIDTLTTASRSNPPLRRKGSLRGHRMCEAQSNTRKQRNVRESSARRRSSSSDANDETNGPNRRGEMMSDSENGVFYDALESHKTPVEEASRATRTDTEDISESSSSCSASTIKENQIMQAPKPNGLTSKGHQPQGSRSQLSRQDSDSSIASSASSLNRKLTQFDDRRGSYGSSTDGGYNTSIENAKQVHEARTENLKNMNKHIESKISGRNNNNNGLKREISRDSGFTETGDAQRTTPSSMLHQNASATTNDSCEYGNHVNIIGDSSKEFKDTAVSNSDYKEQSLSTDHGDVHVVTSTASDLSAAEMTSRSNEITPDGTAVSSASKLADEEGNSELSRVTTKVTDDEVAKLEDFESENRRTKSSRNDSISTSASGVTTASSRHASSMDQELNQENSRLSASKDGRSVSSSVSAAQQLTRHQEKDNIEQSTDGSSRAEHKKVCDKASLSKANIEETKLSEDGLVSDSISASQELEAKSNAIQNEEHTTAPDGTKSLRRQDSNTSSFSEKSSSEKKRVQQLPYEGGSSTELTKKHDSSTVSKSSKSFNEVKENTLGGRTEKSKSENSNAMSSSFSGTCASIEETKGSKLHKTLSTENSSENRVKSLKSNVTHSTSGGRSKDVAQRTSDGLHNDVPQSPSAGHDKEFPGFPRERRLSDASSASTMSNISGLSRENIKPPTYEETMNNLSRANSQSSLFSRQDSSASSIASSAGAFNERQRLKELRQRNSRSSSYDSNTNAKEIIDSAYETGRSRVGRQDSYSSDSTISGGGHEDYTSARKNAKISNGNGVNDNGGGGFFRDSVRIDNQQTGRVINHPIRQVGQSSYSRSFTDPVPDRVPPNRRATIVGDVMVTERDVAAAREEVRSKLRGKDDAYVTRTSRVDEEVSTFNTRAGNRNFRSGFDSFGREMMNIVDSFFEDDDDFGFGLSSRMRRRSLDREAEPISPRRRTAQNPYTVREDLSRLSSSREGFLDSVGVSNAPVEYAASDSGVHNSRRGYGDSNSGYSRVISDSASDCGYDRQRSRASDSSRVLKADSYARNSYADISSASARQKNNNTIAREYSIGTTASRLNDSAYAGDNFESAGKSIHRDKKANSSILSGDWRSDYVNPRDGSSSNYNNRYTAMHGDRFDSISLDDSYGRRAGSECDMSESGSTAHSFRSLPPEVNLSARGRDALADSYKIQNVKQGTQNGRKSGTSGREKVDESRRQRIDSALSWIRSELGELRTQDKALMTQFQRCQESIEQLKKQRPWYEVFSDDEEEADETHWEDWEIDDFDRSCQTDQRDNGATTSSRGNRQGTLFTKEYQRMSIKTTE